MPFSDRFGTWRTQMPTQQLEEPHMGSAPNTMIGILPGQAPLTKPSDVTDEMRADMRNIIHAAKSIHLQGTAEYKTANTRDMNTLIKLCFQANGQKWSTGQYHSLPDRKDIKGGMSDVCVAFGKMTVDMGAVTKCPGNNKRARKDITHRQTNRPGDPGLKVSKPTVQAKVDAHRMAGAPVLMGVEIGSNGLAFKYYDGGHKILPKTFLPTTQLLPVFPTLVDAKLATMKAYELFWLHRGRKYNMEVAVYIARNRLTFYANGGAIGEVPAGEDQALELFNNYKLIRNTTVPEDVIAAKQQVANLNLPGLFDGMLE